MNDLSKPESQHFELSACTHENITKSSGFYFCLNCGSLQPEDGAAVIKSKTYHFPGRISGLKNLLTSWKCNFHKNQFPAEYQKQRPMIIDSMNDWADRLKLSSNSLFLAVEYLDFYISQKPKLDVSQYRILGATSLMLGAKAIELDEHIPFISKLRRQTHLPYATLDFRRCESQLLQSLNFNLQRTTLYDWVESVLSIGAIFDTDELQSDNILREKNSNFSLNVRFNEIPTKQPAPGKEENLPITGEQNSQPERKKLLKDLPAYKFQETVERFENAVKKLAYLILKDGSLIYEDPKILTLSVISYVRRIVGLKHERCQILDSLYQTDNCVYLIEQLREKFPLSQFITRSNLSNLTTFVRQPSLSYYPIQLQRSYTSDQEFSSLTYMNQLKQANSIYKNQYLTGVQQQY